MTEPVDTADQWLVACLCAAWCHVCQDYRATFHALADEFDPEAAWVWVDIEDDEDVVGPVDIDDFPTLLIARGDEVAFFGTVAPILAAGHRALRRARERPAGGLADGRIAGLLQRIRAAPRPEAKRRK